MNYLKSPFAIGEMMIENSLKAFNALGSMQEYSEKMVRTAVDNNKAARETGIKMVQQWAEMTRENSRHFSGAVEGAVTSGTQAYKSQFESIVPQAAKN